MSKHFDMLLELSELISNAEMHKVSDSQIVRSLIFVAVETCFERAANDEIAMLALTSAFNAKLCDKLGLQDWGFNSNQTEGGLQ